MVLNTNILCCYIFTRTTIDFNSIIELNDRKSQILLSPISFILRR